MRPLEVCKYLFDIVQACERIAQFTKGKTFSNYAANPLLRSAVERQFEIIGEAVRQLLRLDPGMSAQISESSRIIAFRNRLIHAYASVADDIVWGMLQEKLPRLHLEAAALLAESDESA